VLGKHVPGYLASLDALKAKKVDEVWCISVNDGYVMAAWARSSRHRQDPDARRRKRELTKKLGLEVDLSKSGMGVRTVRFSMLVDDGVVKAVNVEQPGKLEVSNAETMLSQLG